MQYRALTWNRQSCGADLLINSLLIIRKLVHSGLVKFKLVLTLDVDEMVLNDPS